MAAAQSGPLVVIIDKSDTSIETKVIADALGPGARCVGLDIRTQEEALSNELLPLADAVMVWHTIQIDEAVVARMPRARVLVRVGVGFDNCDLRICGRAGLPVVNVPNYGTEDVADHAMSLILCMYRRTAWVSARCESGEEAHGSDGVAVLAKGTRRVRGTKLGIIGFGRIGMAVAERAKAFFGNDSIYFYDPYVCDGMDKALGVKRVRTVDELAETCDCISIHCDLNTTSRNLVDKALLQRMKRGSFVVNTARGGIIVERDLREMLDSGHIAGAGIDVHAKEPYIGTDTAAQALAGAPNCICTPHTAFFSEESFVEMRTLAAEAAVAGLRGTPLLNVVNARYLPEPDDSASSTTGAAVQQPLRTPVATRPH
jgi:C-terminal binding protein